MSFSNPNILEDPSFHPCVRLGKWTSAKLVSFVPPDGDFELMGYRLGSTSASIRRTTIQTSSSVPIPLRVQPSITTGEMGGSFSISISPPSAFTAGGVISLENILITLFLGDSASAVNGSITSVLSNSSPFPSKTATGSSDKLPPGGLWEFDTISRTLKWRIPKLLSTLPTLSGTWQFDELQSKSRPAPTLNVSFMAPLSNISGLSVVNLKMDGERYSVYKGVRSHLKGTLEIRW